MKKYAVSYTSGASGYGWEKEFDTLAEFEDLIIESRTNYTARITVYDTQLGDFIYWKNCLTYEAKVDRLADYSRDMRTKTRKRVI